MPLKQQRYPGSSRLVRAGTVNDDIAVMWKFMAALLDFIQHEVNCSANNRGITFQFSPRAQVENDRILAGLHLLAQFIHRDPGGAQLPQQASPLPELITNICSSDDGDQAKRAAADV